MLGLKLWSRSVSMNKLRQKARGYDIEPGDMDKTQLIHAIQRAEGNDACFANCHGWCENEDCCFRADCLKG